MSLARLARTPRQRHEARRRLAEIYGWFTEGFDAPDLHRARTLLGPLGLGHSSGPRP